MHRSTIAAALAATSITTAEAQSISTIISNQTFSFSSPSAASTTPIAQYIAHALTTLTTSTVETSSPGRTKTETVQNIVDVIVTACSSGGACQVAEHTQSSRIPPSWTTISSASPPSHTPQPSCQLPTSPLSNEQQVGNSILGTLCQPTFPKWLPHSDGTAYESAPWGDKTTKLFDGIVDGDIPVTNVTRKYEFTISRGTLNPDGVKRDVILVNGQFPGPAIEANWGDSIEITVHNNISYPLEGTAIHWHGFLQRGTNWNDGVPGISQCPIAPGHSFTYTIPAQLYGTSWYHAHYSAQYTAGALGPIIVYGPSQQEYDIDLGPVMLSDWYHVPYFDIVSDAVGSDMSKIPPTSDSLLINGRGQFNCSKPSYGIDSAEWLASNVSTDTTWSCIDGAELAKFEFQPGKVHRLRLMNVGANGVQKFSIDGHKMQVIAYDYVPTTPHITDVVTLGVGQRADVLVTADNTNGDKFWMRAHTPAGPFCGGSNIGEVQAAIYYSGADTSVIPSTQESAISTNDTSCTNLPLNTTSPEYAMSAPSLTNGSDYFQQDIIMTLEMNATGSWEWRMNNQTFQANFNHPALYLAAQGNTSFPNDPQWNMYDMSSNPDHKYIIVNLTNKTPFFHPFHLHGHNFMVLNEGGAGTIWDGSIVNPENPMRRDIQIVPAMGYTVFAFRNDNPGVWPFHCHVAWHLSGGMAVNFITRAKDIPRVPEGEREKTCGDWDAYSRMNVVDQIDAGS